ncbi:hypothetical protein [Streptomyces sp. TE33382]
MRPPPGRFPDAPAAASREARSGASPGHDLPRSADPRAAQPLRSGSMSTSDQDQGQDQGVDAPIAAVATDGKRLTPRQARRLRIVLSSVGMAAMAVVLALRIASRSSVLVVGVYGLALILCGVVIELSRNGRTRLGSWLLGVGLVAAVGADWLLIP